MIINRYLITHRQQSNTLSDSWTRISLIIQLILLYVFIDGIFLLFAFNERVYNCKTTLLASTANAFYSCMVFILLF